MRGPGIAALFLLLTAAPKEQDYPPRRHRLARRAEMLHLDTEVFDVFGRKRAAVEAAGRELRRAGWRFWRLFGRVPARGAVVLRLEPGDPAAVVPGRDAAYQANGAHWVLPWYERDPLTRIPFGGGEARALGHEVGHLMLFHLVEGEGAGIEALLRASYATRLPDWLDEAVAVFMEPLGMRRQRIAQLRGLRGRLIPFSTFFSMVHPFAGKGLGGRPAPARAGDALQAAVFYAQSLAVLDFFLHREGPGLVRALLEGYRTGLDTPAAIDAFYRGRRRRLPRDLDALQAAFVTWLARYEVREAIPSGSSPGVPRARDGSTWGLPPSHAATAAIVTPAGAAAPPHAVRMTDPRRGERGDRFVKRRMVRA